MASDPLLNLFRWKLLFIDSKCKCELSSPYFNNHAYVQHCCGLQRLEFEQENI